MPNTHGENPRPSILLYFVIQFIASGLGSLFGVFAGLYLRYFFGP